MFTVTKGKNKLRLQGVAALLALALVLFAPLLRTTQALEPWDDPGAAPAQEQEGDAPGDPNADDPNADENAAPADPSEDPTGGESGSEDANADPNANALPDEETGIRLLSLAFPEAYERVVTDQNELQTALSDPSVTTIYLPSLDLTAALTVAGGRDELNLVSSEEISVLYAASGQRHLLVNDDSLRINFTKVTLDGLGDGGGVAWGVGGESGPNALTLKGARFENCTWAEHGGAIRSIFANSTLTLENCAFKGCNATNNGGAVYQSGGDLVFKGCELTANGAGGEGGGAYVYVGDLTIIGTTFTYNQAQMGGAADIHRGRVIINDTSSVFDTNGARWRGGGINIEGAVGESVVTNATFSGNTAVRGGGGFWQNGGGTLRVSGSLFDGNIADGSGASSQEPAAIYMDGGTVVTDSRFENNRGVGCAVAVSGQANWRFERVKFIGNKDPDHESHGGALRTFDWRDAPTKAEGTLKVVDCDFSGNEAINGAAIYLVNTEKTVRLELEDSRFVSNRANRVDLDSRGWGGSVHIGGRNTAMIRNCSFTGGRARLGGAISVADDEGNGAVRLENVRISDCEARWGGAIFARNEVLTLTGCEITNCAAIELGGAISRNWRFEGQAQTGIENSTFRDNRTEDANGAGGAIALSNSRLFVTGGAIGRNTAAYGGGLYANARATLSLANCTVSGNRSTIDEDAGGGAIYTASLENVTTNKVTFASNRAEKSYTAIVQTAAAIHAANILNTRYSGSFKYAYNNYDINIVGTNPPPRPGRRRRRQTAGRRRRRRW